MSTSQCPAHQSDQHHNTGAKYLQVCIVSTTDTKFFHLPFDRIFRPDLPLFIIAQMNIELTLALVCFAVGILIGVLLTLLLDRRATRARRKIDDHWQTIVRMEAERDAQAQKNQAYITELNSAIATLEKKFSALANNALNQNSANFLKLANENFEKFQKEATKDLDNREKSIGNLVQPLKENLDQYAKSLNQIEVNRKGAYVAIEKQLESIGQSNEALRNETGRLVQALRKPKVRGRWGEIQLQNVLEHVGMTENIDFIQEQSFDTDDGKKRPDVVIYLPGERCIVIDAKTPIDAYLEGLEADNDKKQVELYKNHAKQLRAQVKNLATTDYQSIVPNSPDFVVMFVPGESFYSTALQHDADLFDYALQHQVMITTPMTLIVLLKVIALGWQQEKLTANSREIAKIGRELYERLAKFAEHMQDHGKSLQKSIDSYNKAIGSMERRVLPTTRKLKSLEVVSSKKHIEAPASVENKPRQLSTPDSLNS